MSKVFRSITASQVQAMLDLQDAAEVRLNPEWKKLEWDFDIAIMVEATELLEHTPWKWWKDINSEINKKQIQLELVDIWHFGMCILLEEDSQLAIDKQGELALSISNIFPDIVKGLDAIDRGIAENGLLEITKAHCSYMISAAAKREFDPVYFFILCYCYDLHPLDVYKLYIAKNVLNQFRQLNGYKEGTYVKIWQGREDNEWLMDILEENASVSPDQLMRALGDMYKLKAFGAADAVDSLFEL